jgi:DNA-binding NtrC family response regulator
MSKVLIVDDQAPVRTALELLFGELHGIPTLSASRPEEVLDLVAGEDIGVVVQDMNFRPEDTDGGAGAALFRAIRKLDPELPVVLVTAFTSLPMAVALIKEGASDYIAKPWDNDRLVNTVRNLLRMRELGQENRRLVAQSGRAQRALAARANLCGLIYRSAAVHEVVALAVNVARSEVPVLITGPNGSGKEKLAEIVQANSARRARPFVKLNVGALPADLLEAELFGAEPGAYTGATKARVGRFEAAEGGTLFLDELGNLPLAGQAKLLRVLQSGEYERLGSNVTRRADVRVVSATNVDLQRAIAAGKFREDLYFRLNVIELYLPPLADRPDDILPLAEHFLLRHGGGRPLSAAARAALLAYEWPGNVRELENRVQRALLVAGGAEITPRDLGLDERTTRPPMPAVAPPPGEGGDDGELAVERAAITEALTRAAGVVSRAAVELGISRQALYRRMQRLGIELERRSR